MKAYLARDNNGKLTIYQERPRWLSYYYEWVPKTINSRYMEIDSNQLFECEPGQYIEVEIEIKIQQANEPEQQPTSGSGTNQA